MRGADTSVGGATSQLGILDFIGGLFRRKAADIDMKSIFAKGAKVDTVDNAHGRFGYSKTNPIPVDDQNGQMDYLARLRCQCGEPFAFHRFGSVGRCPDGHVIDGYEVLCRARKHRFVLYMDMYHSGNTELLPEELTRSEPEGVGLPFRVENFPQGLPDAFKWAAQMRREHTENGPRQ